MTLVWDAPAPKALPAKLMKGVHQVRLGDDPLPVFFDHLCPISVGTDDEWIPPLGGAVDPDIALGAGTIDHHGLLPLPAP